MFNFFKWLQNLKKIEKKVFSSINFFLNGAIFLGLNWANYGDKMQNINVNVRDLWAEKIFSAHFNYI